MGIGRLDAGTVGSYYGSLWVGGAVWGGTGRAVGTLRWLGARLGTYLVAHGGDGSVGKGWRGDADLAWEGRTVVVDGTGPEVGSLRPGRKRDRIIRRRRVVRDREVLAWVAGHLSGGGLSGMGCARPVGGMLAWLAWLAWLTLRLTLGLTLYLPLRLAGRRGRLSLALRERRRLGWTGRLGGNRRRNPINRGSVRRCLGLARRRRRSVRGTGRRYVICAGVGPGNAVYGRRLRGTMGRGSWSLRRGGLWHGTRSNGRALSGRAAML